LIVGFFQRLILADLLDWSDCRPKAELTISVVFCLAARRARSCAKYVALTEAGVAAEDLRLFVVRDLVVGGEQAVVATRLNGDCFILDNGWLMLLGGNQTCQMVPLFVLDQSGVRHFAPTTNTDARRASVVRQGTAAAPGSL
jgi:hypothetical protein